MTIRLVVFWMFMGVIAAFGLYTLKYRVQAIKGEVAATETQLREEKKNLHVLAAEWAYLNRPERVRRLAAKYLDVKPVRGQQLADLATLFEASAQGRPAESPESAKSLTLASGAFHAR